MIVQNFWFIVLTFTTCELLWWRKMSSYNRKWLILYSVVILTDYTDRWAYNMECEELVENIIGVPLILYVGYTIIYRYIKTWKPIVWIDKLIDWAYKNITEVS